MKNAHPVETSLAFHIGRTSLAKYNARPSRLPLYIAVPWLSPFQHSTKHEFLSFLRHQKPLTSTKDSSFRPYRSVTKLVKCLFCNLSKIGADRSNRTMRLIRQIQVSVTTCKAEEHGTSLISPKTKTETNTYSTPHRAQRSRQVPVTKFNYGLHIAFRVQFFNDGFQIVQCTPLD